jgi:hypothetical protein
MGWESCSYSVSFVEDSAGAELGLQLPLSQVFTPKRGKTQICRTIHPAKIPTRIRISMELPFLLSVPSPCCIFFRLKAVNL